jgi:hypothetical protein
MHYRNAMFFAIAGLLASAGFARADGLVKPEMTLDPTVITAAEETAAAEEKAPLMSALDKIGLAKPMEDAKLDLSGWVEGGYSLTSRRHRGDTILPGPFNNTSAHFLMNQLGLRLERTIEDASKFDVGGLVEAIYGTDGALTHSTGWTFNSQDTYQIDITQAYVDVSLPIGSGLTLRAGKFVGLYGTEYANPTLNAFYSHSWAFSAAPYSATGILGIYSLNDQWTITAGISRGWDITMEDNNGAIDGLGFIAYTPSETLSFGLGWNVGPENADDEGHYRVVLDPVMTWQATEKLKIGLEGLYIYDGGEDVWSGLIYASYVTCDYATLNGRLEAYHTSSTGIGAFKAPTPFDSVNVFSITLGATITPMPTNSVMKNLSIRPELRYDFTDSSFNSPFSAGGTSYKDQLTFAVDVMFKF